MMAGLFIMCIHSWHISLTLFLFVDVQPHSPEPIVEEPADEPEEEPGSFSPELLHGDEDEVAIDPEEDRAELVIYLLACFYCLHMYHYSLDIQLTTFEVVFTYQI